MTQKATANPGKGTHSYTLCFLESPDHHLNTTIGMPVEKALQEAGYMVERVPLSTGMVDLAGWFLESAHSSKTPFALVMLNASDQSTALSPQSRFGEMFPYRVEILPERSPVSPRPGTNRIQSDSSVVAEEVMEHLLSLGHKRIGVYSGEFGADPAEDPYAAAAVRCREHLRAARAEFFPVYGVEASEENLETFVSRKITAYWSLADYSSIELLNKLYERGLRVPQNISLVGRYDTPWSTTAVPNLTSTSSNPREMAAQTVTAVNDLFHGHTDQTYMVTPRLVIRESTGPAF